MLQRGFGAILLILVLLAAACEMGPDEFSGSADAESVIEPEYDTIEAPLVSTYYNSSSRTIYANATAFKGTPNAWITTRTVGTGTCKKFGPVMNHLSSTKVTSSVCSSLGLVWKKLSGGTYACTTVTGQTPKVYFYNFTSATQTQLNYNVVDWNGSKPLDQSGWQPAAGNGCPRNFP